MLWYQPGLRAEPADDATTSQLSGPSGKRASAVCRFCLGTDRRQVQQVHPHEFVPATSMLLHRFIIMRPTNRVNAFDRDAARAPRVPLGVLSKLMAHVSLSGPQSPTDAQPWTHIFDRLGHPLRVRAERVRIGGGPRRGRLPGRRRFPHRAGRRAADGVGPGAAFAGDDEAGRGDPAAMRSAPGQTQDAVGAGTGVSGPGTSARYAVHTRVNPAQTNAALCTSANRSTVSGDGRRDPAYAVHVGHARHPRPAPARRRARLCGRTRPTAATA